MKTKTLQGQRYKWEPQPARIDGGMPMPGTDLPRGARVLVGDDTWGTVLGTSDNGEWIGVKFDDSEWVTEYTVEQFTSRFGKS